MSSTEYTRRVAKDLIIQLFRLNDKDWNEQAFRALLEDGACVEELSYMSVKSCKTYCHEKRYDPSISQLELCRRCWFDQLNIRDKGGFDDEKV